MSRHSNSTYNFNMNDSRGGQWSQRGGSFNNDGRNRRFEDSISERLDSFHRGFKDEPYSQGFRDMKPDTNRTYESSNSNHRPRKMIRLEDRGYDESFRIHTNQFDKEFRRDGPYCQDPDRIKQFLSQDSDRIKQFPSQDSVRIKQFPSHDSDRIERFPSQYADRIKQFPSQDSDRIKQFPSQDSVRIKQFPSHDSDRIERFPSQYADRIKQFPSQDSDRIKQFPSQDSVRIKQFPSHDSDRIEQFPSQYADRIKQFPSQDSDRIIQFSSQDSGRIKQLPSQDPVRIKQFPSQDSDRIKQFPSQDSVRIKQFPSHDSDRIERFPSQYADRIKQFPSQDSDRIKQFPSQYADRIKQFPSQDSDRIIKFSSQDSGRIKQLPSQDPVRIKQFPCQDSDRIKQFPSQDSVRIKQFPSQYSDRIKQFPSHDSDRIEQFPSQNSDRIKRFSSQDQDFLPRDQFYQQFPTEDQFQNQRYPPRGRFQPPHDSPKYPPEDRDLPQSRNKFPDDFQIKSPSNLYDSEQDIFTRRNQFHPAPSFSQNVVNQVNKDEIMNQAMSSLKETYSNAMNSLQSPGQMQNNDQLPIPNTFQGNRQNFVGSRLQKTDFAANVVEFKSTDQLFSHTDDGCMTQPHVMSSSNNNKHDDVGGPILEKDSYVKLKLAEQEEVKRRMIKTMKKRGLVKDGFQQRNKSKRLFNAPEVPFDDAKEAQYAEEYRLAENIPPITKPWFKITFDDIRSRSGLVGNIVIMHKLFDDYYVTLEKTAEAWNMKYDLTAEQCSSDGTKESWIATATFNGILLAKTQSVTKGGAKLSASARALWKLYQWYFVVKKGGKRATQTVNRLELKGDARVKDLIIYPNNVNQLKNKNSKECFNLNGTIDDLKNKIKAYANDESNLSDLLFSNDFNAKSRKSLMKYARSLKNLAPRRCGTKLQRQVVLSKRVSAVRGISGWALIDDILKNRAAYNATKQFLLYSPWEFKHKIPYKYPNVTYLVP